MSERAREVRADDAFDVGALSEWLERDAPAGVKQFSGGASNLTYLLSWPDEELVLRRPPKGHRSGTAHDMSREFEFQRRLRPFFPYVPEVLALCEDDAVIGSPFYVMRRVPGVVPGPKMPAEVGTDPELLGELGERFIQTFAQLHAIDVEQAGLTDLGRGSGYVERQVRQWSERYRRSRTPNVPDFEDVMAWLEANRPPDCGYCVIHNDFRLDNMVLEAENPLQVNGVLDWELATLGDPLMDMGSSFAYWVQRGDGFLARKFKRQPTDLRGMPTRETLVRRYGQITGRDTDAWAFYGVFGLFRVAVIAQQIYARYRTGDTTNPAFRFFWVGVRAAHGHCRKLMRSA